MKINTLDLSKTLSDFLFLGIDNPEDKARKIFEIKHSLSAHGFEKYMQYYFQKYKKYQVKLNGKTNEFDSGIDLKGIKYENLVNKYLIVQCKKYSIKDISEDLIAHFYGKIVDKIYDKKEKTEVYYITTSKFTHKAKEFGNNKGIKTIDFYDIYKLQRLYPLEKFKEEIKLNEGNIELENCFEDNQLALKLYDNHFNIETPSDIELYQFLKQIRRDYSYEKQLRLGDIAKNDTLEIIAKERPHNLNALKNAIRNLPKREQNKILRHGDIFIDRLKYLEIEEKKTLSFFEKFFSIN